MEEPELANLAPLVEPTDDDDMMAGEDEDSDDSNEPFVSFELSISDRLRVGYSNMDRACQTELSEIVNLKETAKVLGVVVNDFSMLKKSLYFAKLALQAEYDRRLDTVASELHFRVNKRIQEIEANHQERIEVVRKSYKTQLANALAKLSKDYHHFYENKDAMAEASHNQKLKEMQKHQELMRRNELAQKEMFEILKMQMDEENKKVEMLSGKSSVESATLYLEEIEELRESMKEYESRINYLEDVLEETCVENRKLVSDLNGMHSKLREEEKKGVALNGTIESLKGKMEKERQHAKDRLEEQKDNLKQEMNKKMSTLQSKHAEETNKQLEITRTIEAERLRRQKQQEEQRLELLMKKRERENMVVEPPQDTDMSRLKLIEKRQRAEIARLNKEIERANKLAAIKVKILNEHIHSLRDEMFLRTHLQRQTAKVKQATLTYVKRGTNYVPLGVNPTDDMKPIRKLQLPNIVRAPHDEEDTQRRHLMESEGR